MKNGTNTGGLLLLISHFFTGATRLYGQPVCRYMGTIKTQPPFNFTNNYLWEIEDYVPPQTPTVLCLWRKSQVEEIMPVLREKFQ